MKKIVLAIDSFKGCLTSEEVEQCVAEEIHRLHPQCQTVAIPIADGGEGMLDTLINAMQGQIIYTRAHDPLMRMRTTRYGILGNQQTAVIEMAEINGLTTLSPAERNPMETSTYGTGFGKGIPTVHYRYRRKCHQRCRHGHDAGTRRTALR